MYQGRLRIFRGNIGRFKRRIAFILILVFGLINIAKSETVKLNNLKIKPEDLKKTFNPVANKFNQKTITAIIIDAGHGGKDPGSIGINKIKEKDIVLSFSLELKEELKKILPNVDIVLTRDKDTYPTLQERYKIANTAAKIETDKPENALFISVHANASLSPSAKGFEAYFITAQESSEYARAVSMLENSALVKFDKIDASKYEENSSQLTHNYMIVEQYQKESRLLAQSIVDEVYKVSGISKRNKPVQNALFYVLKGSIMPSTLIEIGFITNEEDAKFMNTKETRIKMVKATALGIKKFIKEFEDTKGFSE
ncbi:N-acetylmuramoyl-L-alanine amidase [Brachyspira aalborgi]|uniref:N-acetylmuramoyl-L-alanine amidase n=1 Tax=Brachyspira aalborgi TaxID=29522 RepID=A0A5C8EJU5_9SPIR|nr:N-acetylmuramoyl-L-alanine amidase [Brachyspira aalborgi]TXJ60271.1 N-acetylmuramoyl-L-alanine amidase [Brachyspira aalborgi]